MGKVVLVGLGNPGPGYSLTRHNLGFMLLDVLTDGARFKKSRTCPLEYADTPDFYAARPLTFMNRSGLAVKCLLEEQGADASELLVACDDFNLPLGKIRLRTSGASGGHNGLRSIMESLGTDGFPRLRMGIGGFEAPDKAAFVLETFSKKELEVVEDMLIDSRNLLECYIKEGPEAAMNRFN